MAVASPGDFGMGEGNRERPWFALQVRSCREKTATTYLQGEGYECFLPLGKSRRRWSDRIKVLEVPLFPGYVFCRLDPNNRLPVLKTPGVIQIVGIGRTLIPVDDDEVAALQCVRNSGLSAQPWSFLQVGQTAQIEHGPLRGLTGIIVHIKSEYKLVLSVTLLQRSVAVEVDGAWLADPQPMRGDRGGQVSSLRQGGSDAWQESGAV
jgi:transcription antitermination factor NusG